jgi:hypothetical protein
MGVMIKPLSSNFYAKPAPGPSQAQPAAENVGQVNTDKVVVGSQLNSEGAKRPTLSQVKNTNDTSNVAPARPETLLLQTVKITEAQKLTKVPTEVLEKAQELLDQGDRGGSYLTLYKELGNEQLLIQAQITTYTGIWGSGALTGNYMAQRDGGDKYNTKLDEFSTEIAQATINAIRKDLEAGGTGRVSDDDLQREDRAVWASKGMANLFPGNVQFADFWNHNDEDRTAFLSQGTWNVVGAAVRSRIPDTSLFGLNQDGRNVSHLIGKRPTEFENNPRYQVYDEPDSRFITVYDKQTNFVEAFWDKKPHVSVLPMPQLPNEPLEPGSPAMLRRKTLYSSLGANRHNQMS